MAKKITVKELQTQRLIMGKGMVIVVRGNLYEKVIELALRLGKLPCEALESHLKFSLPTTTGDLNAMRSGILPLPEWARVTKGKIDFGTNL